MGELDPESAGEPFVVAGTACKSRKGDAGRVAGADFDPVSACNTMSDERRLDERLHALAFSGSCWAACRVSFFKLASASARSSATSESRSMEICEALLAGASTQCWFENCLNSFDAFVLSAAVLAITDGSAPGSGE